MVFFLSGERFFRAAIPSIPSRNSLESSSGYLVNMDILKAISSSLSSNSGSDSLSELLLMFEVLEYSDEGVLDLGRGAMCLGGLREGVRRIPAPSDSVTRLSSESMSDPGCAAGWVSVNRECAMKSSNSCASSLKSLAGWSGVPIGGGFHAILASG